MRQARRTFRLPLTHPPQGMNSFGRIPSGTNAALDTVLHKKAATTAAASDSLQVGKSFRIMMHDHQRDLDNISIAAEISTFPLDSRELQHTILATTICCIRARLVPELLDEGYRDGPTARDTGTQGKGPTVLRDPQQGLFHMFCAPVNEGGALTYTKMLWGVCMYVCMYVFMCVCV
jgi:hypothetical protein